MAFMKRDVNIGLLFLIVISILLFSGFSVYYQTAFRDVSVEYQEKLEQLSDVTKQLSAKREELNETYSMRVKAEQDKQTLDTQYNEVRNENDQLNSDNTNLRLEVSSTKSQLAEKSAQLDATKISLAQTQSSLSSANSKISRIEDDIDRICAKLIAAGGSDDDC